MPEALAAVGQRNAKNSDADYRCLVCEGREVRTASKLFDTALGMTVFALEEPMLPTVAAKTQFLDIARLGLAYYILERVVPNYTRCLQATRNTQTMANGDPASELTTQRVCMLPNSRQIQGLLTFAQVAVMNQGNALRALELAWLAHFRAKDRAVSAAWGNLTELGGLSLIAVRVQQRPNAATLPPGSAPGLHLAAVRADFSEAKAASPR